MVVKIEEIAMNRKLWSILFVEKSPDLLIQSMFINVLSALSGSLEVYLPFKFITCIGVNDSKWNGRETLAILLDRGANDE